MRKTNGALNFFAAAIVAAGIVGCSGNGDETPSLPAEISATELDRRISANSAPFILDVRTSEEFTAGHVPGAVNINHTRFIDDTAAAIEQLPEDKDAEIAVYCRSGSRASQAIEQITGAGYDNVRHVTGDFQNWQAEGFLVQ